MKLLALAFLAVLSGAWVIKSLWTRAIELRQERRKLRMVYGRTVA